MYDSGSNQSGGQTYPMRQEGSVLLKSYSRPNAPTSEDVMLPRTPGGGRAHQPAHKTFDNCDGSE